MYQRALKSIVLVALTSMPAAAQVHADLGPFHIRIATDAPPPIRYERQPQRSSRDDVWIRGYWDIQGDQWAWTGGRWDRPTGPRITWISPRYVREGCPWYRRRDCAWRYEPGHWSNQQIIEGDDYQEWKRGRNNRRR